MSSSNAWLLECGDALTVAVGDHEIVECVQPERYYSIPGTPDYCSSVLSWQGKLVPVMDMAAAIRDQRGLPPDASFVCLLSYQRAPKQALEYLALRISKRDLADDPRSGRHREEFQFFEVLFSLATIPGPPADPDEDSRFTLERRGYSQPALPARYPMSSY